MASRRFIASIFSSVTLAPDAASWSYWAASPCVLTRFDSLATPLLTPAFSSSWSQATGRDGRRVQNLVADLCRRCSSGWLWRTEAAHHARLEDGANRILHCEGDKDHGCSNCLRPWVLCTRATQNLCAMPWVSTRTAAHFLPPLNTADHGVKFDAHARYQKI